MAVKVQSSNCTAMGPKFYMYFCHPRGPDCQINSYRRRSKPAKDLLRFCYGSLVTIYVT